MKKCHLNATVGLLFEEIDRLKAQKAAIEEKAKGDKEQAYQQIIAGQGFERKAREAVEVLRGSPPDAEMVRRLRRVFGVTGMVDG